MLRMVTDLFVIRPLVLVVHETEAGAPVAFLVGVLRVPAKYLVAVLRCPENCCQIMSNPVIEKEKEGRVAQNITVSWPYMLPSHPKPFPEKSPTFLFGKKKKEPKKRIKYFLFGHHNRVMVGESGGEEKERKKRKLAAL